MFNYMLDRLPSEYEGFLIRTDFRIGIQIIQCLNDIDLDESEKVFIAFNLLYGYGLPPIDVALKGLQWFINCGKEVKKNGQVNQEVVYDYDYDSPLLYSAFKKIFNIDVSKEKLHWWEFVALMSELSDCAFSRTVEIRNKKITSNMSAEEKEYYRKAKESCGLPDKLSQEEERRIAEFMAKVGEEIGAI